MVHHTAGAGRSLGGNLKIVPGCAGMSTEFTSPKSSLDIDQVFEQLRTVSVQGHLRLQSSIV